MIIGAADEILTRSIPLMNTPLANNRMTNGFRNLELTISPGGIIVLLMFWRGNGNLRVNTLNAARRRGGRSFWKRWNWRGAVG
jgi:hypothetical protein